MICNISLLIKLFYQTFNIAIPIFVNHICTEHHANGYGGHHNSTYPQCLHYPNDVYGDLPTATIVLRDKWISSDGALWARV